MMVHQFHRHLFRYAAGLELADPGAAQRMVAEVGKIRAFTADFVEELEPFKWEIGGSFVDMFHTLLDEWTKQVCQSGVERFGDAGASSAFDAGKGDFHFFKVHIFLQIDVGFVESHELMGRYFKRPVIEIGAGLVLVGAGAFDEAGDAVAKVLELFGVEFAFLFRRNFLKAKASGGVMIDDFAIDGFLEDFGKDFGVANNGVVMNGAVALTLEGAAFLAPGDVLKTMGALDVARRVKVMFGEEAGEGLPCGEVGLASAQAFGVGGLNPGHDPVPALVTVGGRFVFREGVGVANGSGASKLGLIADSTFGRFADSFASDGVAVFDPVKRAVWSLEQAGHKECALVCLWLLTAVKKIEQNLTKLNTNKSTCRTEGSNPSLSATLFYWVFFWCVPSVCLLSVFTASDQRRALPVNL